MMAAGTLIAEEDWAAQPATKGDLALVQTHLERKIKDVGFLGNFNWAIPAVFPLVTNTGEPR